MNVNDRIIELRRVPASSLAPNPRNWRKHPKAQADALRGVLAEVGIADAVLARERDDGVLELVDGHLRAETLGDRDVPVLVLDVTEEEAWKILATHDPLAAMAEADPQILDDLLAEVSTANESLAAMLEELKTERPEQAEVVEDEVPEPPADPITKPGDLWVLGDHRLLCGDSTKAEDVERLMAGAKADMAFTDPPYGMRLETDYKKVHSNQKLVRSNTYASVHGDDGDFDPRPLLEQFEDARTILLWGADWYYDKLPPGGSFVIWNKRTAEGTKEMRGNHFETCWSREKRRRVVYDHLWSGFTARNREFKREHPTEKPISLLAQMIGDFDGDADLIVDPYLGSGTTLIAAEQLGRKCYGMEISPAYCDVIVKRWETLTGKKATLATDG